MKCQDPINYYEIGTFLSSISIAIALQSTLSLFPIQIYGEVVELKVSQTKFTDTMIETSDILTFGCEQQIH
jgi:hypothetical protein